MRARATGFLIAPGFLLIPSHILDDLSVPAGMELLFDYTRATSPTRITSPRFVAGVRDLDVVILEAAGTAERGAIPIASDPPLSGDALILLHHGLGDHLQMSLNTNGVLGLDERGSRLQYTLSAEPGSSGAPCLDQELRVVAMHQREEGDGRQSGVLLSSPSFSIS